MKQFLILISGFLVACTSQRDPVKEMQFPVSVDLQAMAVEESLIPVHPGVPGEVPFWNAYAQRFIYAPAFDFDIVDGADAYRFKTVPDKSDETFTFISEKPWADLSSIWKDIPISMVHLTVEGMKDGEVIGISGKREFYKASPYAGPYGHREVSYRESIRNLLDYLYNAPYIQYWLEHGMPDPGYGLYGYPSKMFSAVIHGMLLYTDFSNNPGKTEIAMQIARKTADYLISLSEPEGRPLEYFPPTYTGPIYADMMDEYRGEDLSDRQMLIYPSSTALAYLDLYNATSDKKYFDAAIRIADTYKKLQLGNGSWYLLLYIESGDPVAGNYVIPMGIKNFMERLKDEYGITGYEECTRRALRYVEDNLVKEFTWEGQFEDQKPSEKYKNLSKGQACSYALHLLKIAEGDEQVISEAEELIRFAEDQFVIWGKPNPILLTHGVPKGTDSWLTPCVLEQYNFYTPVNASSANLIEAFRTAYDQTGNILYLAKAMDLANTIVRVQKTNGHYPTYLDKNRLEHEGWINCMVYTAKAVNELDEYLNKISPESELFLPMN